METKRNPLKLPEVLDHIGHYLVDRKDLARCTLVCNLWHASFERLFWAEVRCTWCMTSGLYSLMQLGSHKFGFVKALDLDIKYIIGKPDIAVFPNLGSLALRNVEFPSHGRFVADCLCKHQSVRVLRLSAWSRYGYGMCSVPSPVIAQLDKLSCLNELHVSGARIEQPDTLDFYRVCSRVQVLKISHLSLQMSPTLVEAKEWRVRELTLLEVNCHGSSSLEVTDLIASCLKLQHLDWQRQSRYLDQRQQSHLHWHKDRVSLSEFLRLAAEGTWPFLSGLVLSFPGILDRHWAIILNTMKQVKVIKAQETAFGGLSFNALRPHLGMLAELDLSFTEVTSSMMMEILCSCLQLRVLRGAPVLAKDMMSDERPWACSMIEELRLNVRLEPCPGSHTPDGFEKERMMVLVYGKLSRLRQLRILSLALVCPTDTSACQMIKGLDQLKTLRFLESLEAFGQEIGLDEVMWMVSHWKNLRVLKTSNDYKKLGQLHYTLAKHKIRWNR